MIILHRISQNWINNALYILIIFNHFLLSHSFEDRYTSQLPTYKQTVPRKVNEDGVFISHFIPHFYETGKKKRDTLSEQVHYIVPVDGVDHHVTLWPNSDFIAPGMVVETHHLRENKSRISIRQARSTQCHYNGFVKGLDKSRATLSTCYGLTGHVLIPGEEYFIEPSLDEHRNGEYHVHYIYKRSEMTETSNVTNCGTKGKFFQAFNDRLEYEKKYGYKIEKTVRNSQYNEIANFEINSTRPKRQNEEHTTESSEENYEACPPSEKKIVVYAPRFMEVLVVVDYRLDRSFNHDLETFIFTIFNMVVNNFHDKSMGTPLQLKIVRLIYLTYTLPRLDVSRFAPSELLANFCDWQLDINPYVDSHPNHHDFAIFISRFPPCQEKILGLAHMASVCRLDKACTVVSEEGLLLANIITHQVGHSLGADHDDCETGGCAGEEPDGTRYHMNPVMSLRSSEWSICSQHCLVQFINTRISWCLADPPDEHDFKQPDILPGQIYDAIHQCSINFRMRTLACRTGDFCKELFCQITPTKCASTGDPPAHGTPCAKDMWCFNGMCVHRGQRPGAINGEWGPWTQWSSCTRSCGGGVQSRYRSCDKPAPYHGGSYCVGEWMSYRMCNIRKCTGYAPSFRQMQCKMTDKRAYRGHFYMWDNFRTFFEEMKCALVCINEKNQVSIRSPIVIDGTPCSPGTNNICIQGTCRRVGCDFVIDSESKEDGCGKCHGNGTECRVIEGLFNERNIIGAVPFLKLPVGTSMIYIRELDQSSCYFIIGSSINATFFLNSPTTFEQLPGQFDCGGTGGVFENKMNIERIFVRGSIQIPLTVSLKCSEQPNAGIHYQYALPDVEIPHAPIYKWSFLYWDECSVLCGGGTQRARAVCIETRSGEVDDKYCYEKSKPSDVIRTCNHRHCIAKWWVGPWSNCDCKDGEGIMTRLVLCMKVPTEDGTFNQVTREKECCHEPKPRIQKPCNEAESGIFHRRKREKSKEELSSYKVDFYEHDPMQHERAKYWKPDYLQDLDYGDSFNPRTKKPIFNFEEKGMNTSFNMRHPKKKMVRRKNRRKMMNKSHPQRVLENVQLEENEVFPTKKNIIRNEGFQPTLIDEFSHEELVENRERKKVEDLLSKGTTFEEPRSTTVSESLDKSPSTEMNGGSDTSTNPSLNEPLSLPEGDLLIEDVFVEHKKTTCNPRDDVLEPADLGPRFDTANNSAYKLMVIPIIPNADTFPLTDYEIEVFGDTGYWPLASKAEKLFISGEKVFKIINEASRRGTKPPVIELENV